MKRPLPLLEVLGLTAALVVGASCSPNNSVKPGAPVLTAISILEPGAYGPTATVVNADTLTCPAGTAEAAPCDPTATATAVCEAATNAVCRCMPNPMATATPPAATDGGADAGADGGADAATPPPPPAGLWSCSFAPTSMVMYTFDRVLYTPTLDPGDAAGLATMASATFNPPAPMVTLLGDYASNGSPNEVIFPLLGAFRSGGPSILLTGSPALPTSSTITVALSKTTVLAKDGRTPFVGATFSDGGATLLMDGIVTFNTQAFIATITPPPAPMLPADAGAGTPAPAAPPDMTPATITFSNTVDPMAVAALITVTATPPASGAPVMVDVASMDGLNFTVTPKTTWPPSSQITITVDATATDLAGDPLGTAATVTFPTSAM